MCQAPFLALTTALDKTQKPLTELILKVLHKWPTVANTDWALAVCQGGAEHFSRPISELEIMPSC